MAIPREPTAAMPRVVGGHGTNLEPMGDRGEHIGVVYHDLPASISDPTEISRDEMEALLQASKNMQGVPLLWEHDPARRIGTVQQTRIMRSGDTYSACTTFCLDEGANEDAAAVKTLIRNKKPLGMSLAHRFAEPGPRDPPGAPRHMKVDEISLCERGKRPMTAVAASARGAAYEGAGAGASHSTSTAAPVRKATLFPDDMADTTMTSTDTQAELLKQLVKAQEANEKRHDLLVQMIAAQKDGPNGDKKSRTPKSVPPPPPAEPARGAKRDSNGAVDPSTSSDDAVLAELKSMRGEIQSLKAERETTAVKASNKQPAGTGPLDDATARELIQKLSSDEPLTDEDRQRLLQTWASMKEVVDKSNAELTNLTREGVDRALKRLDVKVDEQNQATYDLVRDRLAAMPEFHRLLQRSGGDVEMSSGPPAAPPAPTKASNPLADALMASYGQARAGAPAPAGDDTPMQSHAASTKAEAPADETPLVDRLVDLGKIGGLPYGGKA
jgi:hypothetical protein